MTGLLVKKHHIAVLGNDKNSGFVSQMVNALRQWYSDKVVIETYDDTYDLFEAVNVNRVRNKPFDVAIMTPQKMAEKLVLQRSNPSLKVIVCQDAKTFKTEATKVML